MSNVIKYRQIDSIEYGVEVAIGNFTTDIGSVEAATTLQDGNVFIVSVDASKFLIVRPDGTEVSTGTFTTDVGNIRAVTTLQDGNVFMVSDDASKFLIVTPDGTKVATGTFTTDIGLIYSATVLQNGNVFMPSDDATKFLIVRPDGTEVSTGTFTTDVGNIEAVTTLQDGNVFIPAYNGLRFSIVTPDGTEVSTGTLTDIGSIETVTTLQDGNVFIASNDASKFLIVRPDGTEVATGSFTTDIGSISAATVIQNGNVFIPASSSTKFMIIDPELHEKLTPKSDLVYNYKLDHDGNVSTSTVFNIDGTTKINEITNTEQVDNYQYTSVGKGQFMTMRPSPTAGAQLKLWDKNTGAELQIQNLGLIAGTDAWTEVQKYKSFTYLGKCFKSKGNNDRWVILNQAVSTTNLRAYPAILNIDTWTIYPFTKLSGFGDNTISTYYDFTYDGEDKVYCMYYGSGDYSNRRVLYFTMDNIWNYAVIGLAVDKVPESSLKDSAGANVPANRIYGISFGAGSIRLVMRTKTDGVRVILLSDNTLGGTLAVGTNGTVAMIPAGDNIDDFNQSQSYVMSTDSGTLLMKRSNTSMITLSSSTNEKVLKVINFKHTENVETVITLVMVNVGNHNRFIRKFTIDWSAGYGSAGVVTNELLSTIINAGETTVNDNEISNSCNSYDIGKFYNYGLQKQFNNNN